MCSDSSGLDIAQWQALVNTVMNLGLKKRREISWVDEKLVRKHCDQSSSMDITK
jgi:hypothetical protein